MFKTIFSKLVAVFIALFIVAFSITGFMLSYFLDNHFTAEKGDMLVRTSTAVRQLFEGYLENLDQSDSLRNAILSSNFNDILYALGYYSNSSIWIVNEYGYIIRSSESFSQSIINKYGDGGSVIKIPENKSFTRLTQQETTDSTIGDFSGFFKDPSYSAGGDLWLTVGCSFKYQDSGGSDTMVVIYLHTPVRDLKNARDKVFQYFLSSAGAAIIFSLIMIYIFSLRLTRPLKQIKNAAARIANGEFEKRLNIKAKDEIGELAGTFNQMAVSLQNLEEMRRGFIANVSHELRTPMTSIRGFVEGILDGTIPSDRQSHYLTIVRDETDRLNRLVNDLLDLAKMEAGEMKLDIMPLNINELVRKCVINLETLLLEKNLTVDADFEEEELFVKADADAIERVLYNLMHNAIKFTPAGGNIKLMTRMQKGRAEVTVKDNGIGIEENELDMIWDRFYKTDKSRSKDKTGTGLGLAIVKNIINEHGQRIWAESKQGEGTSFTFTLERAYEEVKNQ